MVKKSKPRKYSPKSIAIKLTIILILAIGLFFGYWEVFRYRSNRDQIEMVAIRELVISAIETLKQPAVIEPKTGDIYFPPEKLYLPNVTNKPPLTYSVLDDGSGGTEFTITSKYAVGALTSKLYSVQNLEKMFEELPELQACSRGIRLAYEKLTIENASDYNLISSHALNNGKTIYIYSEKTCTQLGDTAERLKNLQSY